MQPIELEGDCARCGTARRYQDAISHARPARAADANRHLHGLLHRTRGTPPARGAPTAALITRWRVAPPRWVTAGHPTDGGGLGLPVGRPREGGGGGGQPPPSKTSKPTSQTTCWRIGFCGRRSDAAHTNKSPAKGGGARWVHLCVLPYRARTVPPKRGKPTTPTPSRAVGCALRGGPA